MKPVHMLVGQVQSSRWDAAQALRRLLSKELSKEGRLQ